jgi:hypothetical protein
MSGYEKLVLVTRKTRLAELIERFNTRRQAQFYLQQAGLDFEDYAEEDDTYRRALDAVLSQLDLGLKLQLLDRALVSTYLFAPSDVVMTLGQDGLVANTAKYAGAQPLIGVNPDPKRFDGVLLPFQVPMAHAALQATLKGEAEVREVTLAEAQLSDGQRLLAFNDLFLGARTHVSARYRLDGEAQSSSGLLVSTGAGSTGWFSSVLNMARAVGDAFGESRFMTPKLTWEGDQLVFVVREPFVSRHSTAKRTAGLLAPGAALRIESLMPSGGVVFSDGMEEDCLAFNSGVVATVRAAAQRARLVSASA